MSDSDAAPAPIEFPSGVWFGFFLEPESPQRFGMDLNLQFEQEAVSGRGKDYVGEFKIAGRYDPPTRTFVGTKDYEQHSVTYEGIGLPSGIVGEWNIDDQISGPFFIWPQKLGDMTGRFEQAFLQYALSDTTFEKPPPDRPRRG